MCTSCFGKIKYFLYGLYFSGETHGHGHGHSHGHGHGHGSPIIY
jgi:hypothetical protein